MHNYLRNYFNNNQTEKFKAIYNTECEKRIPRFCSRLGYDESINTFAGFVQRVAVLSSQIVCLPQVRADKMQQQQERSGKVASFSISGNKISI